MFPLSLKCFFYLRMLLFLNSFDQTVPFRSSSLSELMGSFFLIEKCINIYYKIHQYGADDSRNEWIIWLFSLKSPKLKGIPPVFTRVEWKTAQRRSRISLKSSRFSPGMTKVFVTCSFANDGGHLLQKIRSKQNFWVCGWADEKKKPF